MSRFKMNSLASKSRGVALIFALLLLLVLTVIGVGTLSTVSMQERMAGNANLQTLAFKAASAAVTESLEWGFDPVNWPLDADGSPRRCLRGLGNWVGDWSVATTLTVPNLPAGFRVEYRKRIGCFEAPGWVLLSGQIDVPQQLLALGRGDVVRSSDGAVVATREIEVRLEERGLSNPTCLIQTGPLSLADLRMPTSNAFEIDARPNGCPIQADLDADAEAMRTQLGPNRIGNYQPVNPGVTSGPLEGAWGDPQLLARATNALKIGLRGYESWAGSLADNPFRECAGRLMAVDQDWQNANSCGATVTDGITYVAGNLDVAGNCTINGQIIVEGRYYSNGTPAYTGDLLLLGGEIDVRGFGQADNSGLVILQNLEELQVSENANSVDIFYDPDLYNPDLERPRSKFIVRGGGTATITPLECPDMQANWNRLNNCLERLEQMVTPGVWSDPDGNFLLEFDYYEQTFGLGRPDMLRTGEAAGVVRFPTPKCDSEGLGPRLAIASWREFIDRGRWDQGVP